MTSLFSIIETASGNLNKCFFFVIYVMITLLIFCNGTNKNCIYGDGKSAKVSPTKILIVCDITEWMIPWKSSSNGFDFITGSIQNNSCFHMDCVPSEQR